MTINYYTDGAFSSKTEMGGWAMVCIQEDNVLYTKTGYEPYSTNNRMELQAFFAALQHIETADFLPPVTINVYTDSAYLANCFNQKWYSKWLINGWRTSDKQEVKNQDLWKPIIAAYIKLKSKYQLNIIKVKSHSDNQWNNYCDLLAVKSRKQLEVE